MSYRIHFDVLSRIVDVFDNHLIENNVRGLYVECLVAQLLGEGWKLSGSWDYWDLEHADGTKVEVKQSAAKQTWYAMYATSGKLPARFSIAPTRGYREGGGREDPRRYADIYIFAWHGRSDDEADHRDADQWSFYVVDAASLPDRQKSIGLGPVKSLAAPVGAADLKEAVDSIRQKKSNEPDLANTI